MKQQQNCFNRNDKELKTKEANMFIQTLWLFLVMPYHHITHRLRVTQSILNASEDF